MNGEEVVTADDDVELAFNWMLTFLQPGEWARRKADIEVYLNAMHTPQESQTQLGMFNRLIGPEDRIAWYLYLVETSQHEPFRTEVNQAARVLPVFKRLGSELGRLREISGVEAQVEKLLGPSRAQPDSVLFEIVVALLWARNGWKDVSFIPPSRSEKRPDILASDGKEEWFIETKRLSTNSEYAQKERGNWLRMWSRLKECLSQNRYPFVLDITFHVELNTLPDDFLVKALETKLKRIAGPCHPISNETIDVSVKKVDFSKVDAHLKSQYVKLYSRQLQKLIGGTWERKKGFTFLMNGATIRVGGEYGVNQYVKGVDWAAAAYWHCDAPRATEAKARDIRGHLSKAIDQLPSSGRSVIHVGIETPDGEDVELERYARIVDSVSNFDANGKNLSWIYTHLYESYAPPETSWQFDETIYKFGIDDTISEPLSDHFTISQPQNGAVAGAHWLIAPP